MDTSATLLLRSVIEDELNDVAVSCETGNDFNGALPLRISSIFVILIGSLAGILFPLLARPPSTSTPVTSIHKLIIPPWLFFALKHFGSGILLATAFIHLLAPASEALRSPCLTGLITEYPWVEGIVLITIVGTFFVEILVNVFAGQTYTNIPQEDGDLEGKGGYESVAGDERREEGDGILRSDSLSLSETETLEEDHSPSNSNAGLLSTSQTSRSTNPQHIKSQNNWKPPLTRLLLLESSIILHSLLIGLSLSVAGAEFPTLYAVLIFHQTFEGLGLGTRLAEIPWPPHKKFTPYMLGVAYALSTPLAITVGLCVRGTYSPGSQGVLIVSGVFDSVSAGVLIYSGLVEVMAREFLLSSHGENQEGRRKDVRSVFAAFFWLCVGAAAMAVLGKWA
ncbi:Zinc/iron permease [Aspergillus keveii]|uniref:Zinc/iron permease n=1 Tax=Aspergillus keveii TaxID=714993 RepID=A0ABR4FKW2_9EURO